MNTHIRGIGPETASLAPHGDVCGGKCERLPALHFSRFHALSNRRGGGYTDMARSETGGHLLFWLPSPKFSEFGYHYYVHEWGENVGGCS